MEGDHHTWTVSERTNAALGHAPARRGWSLFPWGQRVNLPTEKICRLRRDSGSKGWRFRAHPSITRPRRRRQGVAGAQGRGVAISGAPSQLIPSVAPGSSRPRGWRFRPHLDLLSSAAVSWGVEGDGSAREEACR